MSRQRGYKKLLSNGTWEAKVPKVKEVVTYARDVMRLEIDAILGNADLPKAREQDRKGAAKPKVSISLTRARAVAAHMHVLHQFAMWIMRVLGLRIGEAFGIHVEDVTDLGEHAPGLVFIHRQGGRVFRTEGPEGEIVKSDAQEWLKNHASIRTLVVPPPLMDLIRIVIDVFHTDEYGRVDGDRRLIPGLARDNASGAGSFREALKNAARRVGIDCDNDDDLEDVGLPRVWLTPDL